MKRSIIIPAYNEEKLISESLERVCRVDFGPGCGREIIVVDDGSSDGTHEVVERFIEEHPEWSPEIRLVRHGKNRGKGAAVRSGMFLASGEILVIQDADLEYEPQDLLAVTRPVADGECSVVYGSRILKEKSLGRSGVFGWFTGKHPRSYWLAYIGGVMVTRWINLWTGSGLTDAPTCYKCFHRSALKGIHLESDDFSWEPEITVKLLLAGHSIREVPIAYHPRRRDEGKKIHWRHGVGALITVLREVIRGWRSRRA